jgi:hypothetical protein
MNVACMGAQRAGANGWAEAAHAKGPAGESGDAVRAPRGPPLLETDVHPIAALGESVAALSQLRG